MPTVGRSHGEDTDGHELHVLPNGRLPDEEAQLEGGAKPNVPDIGQQQNKINERDDPDEMSPDERSRLWGDLEAETGYSSYLDYFEAQKKPIEDSGFLRDLPARTKPEYPTCAILDLSDKDSRPRVSLRCCSSSASVLLASLRQPAVGGALRVVLWRTSEIGEDMVNAIGLGLKIHPRFFYILCTMSGRLRTDLAEPNRLDQRPLAPNSIAIGGFVVTKAHCYHATHLEVTPTVLIAGENFGTLSRKTRLDESLNSSNLTVGSLSESLDEVPAWISGYLRVLQHDIVTEGGSTTEDSADLLFRSLIPVLWLNMFSIREKCHSIREDYYKFIVPRDIFLKSLQKTQPRHRYVREKPTRLEDLFEWRKDCRRTIEDSEDTLEQIQRFMRPQQVYGKRRERSWIEDDTKQVHLEAHRLEAEVRDYLQLQTGVVAIQESRRSIELSNLQIEEGRRGKSIAQSSGGC